MNSILKLFSFVCFVLFVTTLAIAQPTPTSSEDRWKGYEQRKQLKENSLITNWPLSNIGPSIFSGRVTDIEVSPDDPTHFYVAYASGGLWYTHNNGTSFEPIFDHEIVMTIGDIAVDWENDVIWLGSGENNSSRSSYAGAGIFKSSDKGKTWEYSGLPESHHISRIIIHPNEPNILWVATLGHLYSPNTERGIYKSTDGGKNWEMTLDVNENSGAVDLIIDPQDPDVLYAAMWHRERRSWNFVESGTGSGIYRSADGGDTWSHMTSARSGFPQGEGIGRIGLTVHLENGQRTLYALLDNYDRRPKEADEEEEDVYTKENFRKMSAADFAKLDDEKLEDFLRSNRFAQKYSAEKVKKMVEMGKIKPTAIVEFLENANSLLFDTPVIAAEVYRSDDEGKTWSKTHKGYLDRLYNSYGYYFGQIRVSPFDKNKIYVLGVPILISTDGGANWENINGSNVHADHHALWVNPNRDQHIILGNDGGINISYDDGKTWTKNNQPQVGQFYSVAVDNAEPYNVYGGLQDNGVWMGPHTYRASNRWHSSGRYPYKSIYGGDGMQVAIDTRDNVTVYTGSQFGFYSRVNTETGQRKMITPRHDLGERPYRWNWETPIHLSVHNQDIFYMGANMLFRSFNQGDDFDAISGDLTKGGVKGDVPYGTLTSIHESPLKFGLLYTGSDDGLIHVSHDGGNSWNKISDNLPQDLWVSTVQASAHETDRVYTSLNGYRWDDFTSYVYASEDQGKNWNRIGLDLPVEPVNVIKEDPANPNILFVGTDHGLYISLDRGESFMPSGPDLPAVAVHDVAVQARENHLLIGTHGRSFYKGDLDYLHAIQGNEGEAILVFEEQSIGHSSSWGQRFADWAEYVTPEVDLGFYSANGGSVEMSIAHDEDLVLKKWKVDAEKGINFSTYDLSIDPGVAGSLEARLNEKKKEKEKVKLKEKDDGNFYLPAGKYMLTVRSGSNTASSTFEVKSNSRGGRFFR